MYLTEYGRFVLEAYNRRHSTQHTARTFFDEVLWPVAFNAPDEKHLYQVSNSSFFQAVPKDIAAQGSSVATFKRDRFFETLKEVSAGKKPVSGAVAVGFMAGGPDDTTSGMVSSVRWAVTEESLLLSWIGGAASVGFGGGYDLALQAEDLALFVVEGWRYYRRLLETDDTRKGRQLETWNGLWLLYGAAHRANLEAAFNRVKAQLGEHTSGDAPVCKLDRPEWVKQFFQLAKDFPELDDVTVYAYSCGSTNKTLGFSTIYLGAPRRLEHYWQRLLGPENAKNKDIQTVYKTQLGFQAALLAGGIGMRAMQPKDIRKFVGNPEMPKTDEKNRDTFNTYITWTRAMLNNEDFDLLAERLAKELIAYAAQDTKGRKIYSNKVDSVWTAASKQGFVAQLTELLESTANTDTLAPVLKDTVKAIQLRIPADQFRWFHTLGKFYYRLNQSSNPETQND